MKIDLDRYRYNTEVVAKWLYDQAKIWSLASRVGACWEGRESYSEYQRTHLKRLLVHANRWVPAYSGKLTGAIKAEESAYEIVKTLPFTTKDDVRSLGERNYSRAPLSAKKCSNTGGSTGQPLELRYHSSARVSEMAHQLFFWRRGGYAPGNVIASFDGVSIPESQRERGTFWARRFPGFPFGAVRYSAHYWQEPNIPAYLASIAALKPPFLRGYPSFLRRLCSEIRDRNMPLWKVNAVQVSSEAFDQATVDYISETLNCPVFGQYGHTEGAVFGFTEANATEYYCSPLHGITEVVRSDTLEPCGVGEEGEVVVTGFSTTAQPLIRYRTGDVAVFGGEKNGFTVLRKLVGRVSDYIINRDGERVYMVGLVFGQHLRAFSAIRRWQVVQRVPGEIEIRIDGSSAYTDEYDQEIAVKVGDTANVALKIVKTTDFIQTKRGKTLFVYRED